MTPCDRILWWFFSFLILHLRLRERAGETRKCRFFVKVLASIALEVTFQYDEKRLSAFIVLALLHASSLYRCSSSWSSSSASAFGAEILAKRIIRPLSFIPDRPPKIPMTTRSKPCILPRGLYSPKSCKRVFYWLLLILFVCFFCLVKETRFYPADRYPINSHRSSCAKWVLC